MDKYTIAHMYSVHKYAKVTLIAIFYPLIFYFINLHTIPMEQSLTTNNLRALRKARGLPQKEVATLIGHKYQDRISHWEKGQMVPHMKNLIKLSRMYKVPIHDLFF